MTLLSIAQTCAARLLLPSPASFYGSTDNNMILLKAMIEEAIQEIRNEYPWPELQKEYTFQTIAGLTSYRLPADFNSTLTETLWNRDQRWPLLGPLDAVQWQVYKSGLVATQPRQRFRIKGWTNNQFFIDPSPSSYQTLVYEYLSRTAIRPVSWVANTPYTANTYVSNDGLILKCSTGGTSSTTQPPEFGRDGTVFWRAVPSYVASISYYVGQYVFANSKVYKCTTAGKGGVAPSHTSGSATTGTCVFLYISTPSAWVAGTSYAVDDTVSATGLAFICVIAGISSDYSPKFSSTLLDNNTILGATTDSISDGTAVWTVVLTAYETFNADTDEVLLDNQMIVDGAVWRFLRARGFDYEPLMAQAENQKDIAKTKLQGVSMLSVNGRANLPPYIGYWSYPVQNYGID